MPCICALKLNEMLSVLASLQLNVALPTLPPVMAQLSMAAGGLASANAALSANLSAMLNLSLPPLPLPPAMLASLSATASAMAQIQAGLGINLLAPNASASLALTIGTLNANLSMIPPLPNLSVQMLLKASAMLSLVAQIKAAFGINLLLGASAALALQAKLNAMASLSLAMAPPNLASWSIVASLAASLGINLAMPGAMAQFSATLSFLASLSLPSITVSLPGLANLLALLNALINIQAQLGVSMMAPDFSLQLNAALSLLASLSVSLSAELSLLAAAGLSWAPILPSLGLNLSAMANLNLSLLAGIPLPNLGPLTLAASFALQSGSLSLSPCGVICPM